MLFVVFLKVFAWREGWRWLLCALSVFVIVSVLFVVFIAAICLPDCAMDPGTQPTELEVLRRRVADLEVENESIREHFWKLSTKFGTFMREREAMRTQLQKYEKVLTSVAQAQDDALTVLREGIPATVSGDTPSSTASDVSCDNALPTKRRRSDSGPDGAE